MRVLFDTNVLLDIIVKREPFLDDSCEALRRAYDLYTPCVSTTTITDIVYISKKSFTNAAEQKKILLDFFSDFKICDVKRRQIKKSVRFQYAGL